MATRAARQRSLKKFLSSLREEASRRADAAAVIVASLKGRPLLIPAVDFHRDYGRPAWLSAQMSSETRAYLAKHVRAAVRSARVDEVRRQRLLAEHAVDAAVEILFEATIACRAAADEEWRVAPLRLVDAKIRTTEQAAASSARRALSRQRLLELDAEVALLKVARKLHVEDVEPEADAGPKIRDQAVIQLSGVGFSARATSVMLRPLWPSLTREAIKKVVQRHRRRELVLLLAVLQGLRLGP